MLGMKCAAFRASTLVVCLVAPSAATILAAQLPPDVQADRLWLRAERQIGNGEYPSALASLDEMLSLQVEHDVALPESFLTDDLADEAYAEAQRFYDESLEISAESRRREAEETFDAELERLLGTFGREMEFMDRWSGDPMSNQEAAHELEQRSKRSN